MNTTYMHETHFKNDAGILKKFKNDGKGVAALSLKVKQEKWKYSKYMTEKFILGEIMDTDFISEEEAKKLLVAAGYPESKLTEEPEE